MIDAHRLRTDKINRENVMITDNPGDFPAGSPVADITAVITAKMQQAVALDADLMATLGDKMQAANIKGNNRDDLIDRIEEVVIGAIAVGDSIVPGITAKFRMPRPRTDQNLIADADAKYADTAAPLEAEFLKVIADKNFRANLKIARDVFQQSRDAADSALEQHGEAVGAIAELFREIMSLSRRRSAMVKLKYRHNAGKSAAWKIASHLERAPKREKKAANPPNDQTGATEPDNK